MCEITLGHPLGTCRARGIERQCNAGAELGQFLGSFLAWTRLAGGNVDFGALMQETFGDHLADAARAAGNQRCASFEREKVLHWCLLFCAGRMFSAWPVAVKPGLAYYRRTRKRGRP